MNFHSLRSFLACLLALGSAALVSSCGGGGASGSTENPPIGGLVRMFPDGATLYAGIPFTFTIVGGRPPYALSSSEPSLFSLPAFTSAHLVTVVPSNPGVIDADLQPGELPVKSVNVFFRDATGDSRSIIVKVAQNFLTGYGVTFTPTNCPAGSAEEFDPPAQACAGGESVVRMQATFAGNLHGNEEFRLEVIRGGFSLRHPTTGQVAQSILVNSDHSGTVTGIVTVPPGVPTQTAVIRVIHVPTGVYADHVFVISRGAATAGQITALPDEFTFTGPLENVCGTGTADFFVFDGVPPYTAVSSHPGVVDVTPSSGSQPGRFTITASNPNACVDDALIVVTDSLGGRDTVTVTTEEGSDQLPEPEEPPDLVVAPTTITLGCGQSGSVSVAGGTGSFRVNSTNSEVTATTSTNTVTISRAGPAGPGSGSMSSTISITDGTDVVTVTVTSPATCP